MIDREFILTAAAVAGGLGVLLTLLDKLVNLFINDVSTTGAFALASMGLLTFTATVFMIANRIEINKLKGGNS